MASKELQDELKTNRSNDLKSRTIIFLYDTWKNNRSENLSEVLPECTYGNEQSKLLGISN